MDQPASKHATERATPLSILSRRRFLQGFAMMGAASIATLLAACGGDDDDAPAATTGSGGGGATATSAGSTGGGATATSAGSGGSTATSAATSAGTEAATTTAAGEPIVGGTLIQVMDTDPPVLNKAVTTSGTVGTAAGKVQQGLIALGSDFLPMPELASSWEVNDTAEQYTFHLQEGVTFSDGTPMTSEDVKYTMIEVAAVYQGVAGRVLQFVDTIDTPDELTVVINFTAPNGALMGVLNSTSCPILPKHLFEGTDPLTNPSTLTDPIGTGPFILTDWKHGESLTFDRNPNYWEPGKPYLDRIILRIIPQTSARISAMTAGEVDYMTGYMIDPAESGSLKDDPNVQYVENYGTPAFLYTIFNNSREPFSDRAVRQALFTAIDRDFLVDTGFYGLANIAKSSIPPSIPWAYNPDIDLSTTFAYDPERAAQMLDDAGYTAGSNGIRFPINYIYEATRAGHSQMAEVIRANWTDIGIDVTLVPLELQVMLETVFANWDYDATLQTNGTFGDPALGISRAYTSEAQTRAPFTNASGFSTPEVDEWFELGATQSTYEARAEYYYKIQEFLAEEVPTLPLIDYQTMEAGRTNFEFASALWNLADSTGGWQNVWKKD